MKANVKSGTKRALSFLLVLLMMLTMLPMAAFAVDGSTKTVTAKTGLGDGELSVTVTAGKPQANTSGGYWNVPISVEITKKTATMHGASNSGKGYSQWYMHYPVAASGDTIYSEGGTVNKFLELSPRFVGDYWDNGVNQFQSDNDYEFVQEIMTDGTAVRNFTRSDDKKTLTHTYSTGVLLDGTLKGTQSFTLNIALYPSGESNNIVITPVTLTVDLGNTPVVEPVANTVTKKVPTNIGIGEVFATYTAGTPVKNAEGNWEVPISVEVTKENWLSNKCQYYEGGMPATMYTEYNGTPLEDHGCFVGDSDENFKSIYYNLGFAKTGDEAKYGKNMDDLVYDSWYTDKPIKIGTTFTNKVVIGGSNTGKYSFNLDTWIQMWASGGPVVVLDPTNYSDTKGNDNTYVYEHVTVPLEVNLVESGTDTPDNPDDPTIPDGAIPVGAGTNGYYYVKYTVGTPYQKYNGTWNVPVKATITKDYWLAGTGTDAEGSDLHLRFYKSDSAAEYGVSVSDTNRDNGPKFSAVSDEMTLSADELEATYANGDLDVTFDSSKSGEQQFSISVVSYQMRKASSDTWIVSNTERSTTTFTVNLAPTKDVGFNSDVAMKFDDSSIYVDSNGKYASMEITQGTEIILPTPTTVENYVFQGWQDLNTGVTYPVGSTYKVEDNVQFQAVWKAEMVVVSWANSSDFTITPAGSSPYLRKGGDFTFTVTTPEGVKVTGVTASSGTLDYSGAVYILSNIQDNATISVTTERTVYTVTYNSNYEGGPTATVNKYHNEDILLTAPASFTRQGYELVGWATTANGNVAYNAGDVYSGNIGITLYAVWQAEPGTVTYESGADAGVVTNMPGNVSKFAGLYTIPNIVPVRAGYTFQGWKDANNTVYQPGSQLEVSKNNSYVLTAQWGENTYNVKIDQGMGFTSTADPAVVNENGTTTVTITVAPGYDASAMVVSANGLQLRPDNDPGVDTIAERVFTYTITDITEDQKIAVYGVVPATYHITYNAEGGTINTGEVLSYTYGTSVTLPTDVTKTGYTFNGWYAVTAEGVEATATEILLAGTKGNMKFEAKWTANTYKVTLKDDVADVTVTANNVALSKAEDVSYSATYNESVAVTVTAAEGYDLSTMIVSANGRELSLVGINGDEYSYFIDHVVEDTVIAVVISRVGTKQTVTYDDGHNDTTPSYVPAPQTVIAGDTVTVSSYIPERAGYYFTYWTYPVLDKETGTTEQKIVLPGDTLQVDESIVLTANWQVVTYTITYVLNGGTMDVAAEQTYNVTDTIILPTKEAENVKRFGYEFAGWYTISNFKNADGTDEAATTLLPAGTTGDKVFYAKWNNAKGVEIDIEKVDEAYIATVVTPTTPEDLSAVETGTAVSITFNPTEGNALDKDCITVYTSGANDNGAYTALLPDYTVTENADSTVTVSFVMPEAKVLVDVKRAANATLAVKFDDKEGVENFSGGYNYNGASDTFGAIDTTTGMYTGTVPVGADGYFQFTLADGYHINGVEAYSTDANNQAKALDYTLTYAEDTGTYTVTFVMAKGTTAFIVNLSKDYSITAEIEETAKSTEAGVAYKMNGAEVTVIKPANYTLGEGTLKAGEGVQFTVEALEVAGVKNEVRNVYVTYDNDGATVEVPVNLTEGVYSFNMPAADVVIHVDLKDWTKITLDTVTEGYEGDVITITATVYDVASLNEANQGTVKFYWTNAKLATADVTVANIEALTAMGVAAVDQSGAASVNFELPDAATNPYIYFYAIYGGSAYFLGSYTKEPAEVKVLSTAIAWTETADVANNELTIYEADANGNKTTATATAMSAGHTYYLEIPAVVAADNDTAILTADTDYRVVWLYADSADAASDNWKLVDWTDNTSNTLKVTPEYVHYSYKAQVYPTNVEATTVLSHYNKAVKYDADYKRDVNDEGELQYVNYLETRTTSKVELAKTETKLVITGAVEEAADVFINGKTDVFAADHFAQYENQEVTLKAEVIEEDTKNTVSTGKVYFYRYVDGVNDELLNENGLGVQVVDGVAAMQYAMPAYTAGDANSEANTVRIYAVYKEGATYAESASVVKTDKQYSQPVAEKTDVVYVMSAQIMTPVVKSSLEGEVNGAAASETTYTDDLTELLAGVSFELTLKEDFTTEDYSVVAMDGRKVAAGSYDIQWLYKTGSNEENANGDSANAAYTVDAGKMNDKFRVKLTGKGVYDGSIAYSKYVVVGTLQDVEIAVTAAPDEQYQLGEVELKAAVKGAENGDTAETHPTGKVTFYYLNDTTWVKIGETRDGVFNANDGTTVYTFTTTELPVTEAENDMRELEITAVYEGDAVYAASRNYDAAADTWADDFAAAGVTNDTVTIYSSAVHVEEDVRNVATSVAPERENGIVITVEGDANLADAVAANESVTLNISDVFTLDYGNSVDDWALLQYGTDYTVEWQKVENYSSWNASGKDINSEWPWQKIGEGESCTVQVTENTAYRAVVSVKDTAPVQASWQQIDQGTVGKVDTKDGARTYYSNILTAKNGQTTLTVNLNTSEHGEGWEGAVQGETVTIHTYASGAQGETPIAEMTVRVGKVGGAMEEIATRANVNGHVAFDWVASEPGFYVIEVEAKPNNGYNTQYYKEYLTVRDNDYKIVVNNEETVYNGKTQGVSVSIDEMCGDFAKAAQASWKVVYTDAENSIVEPNEAGVYHYKVTLPASAYWTEKSVEGTFTIAKRDVSIDDLTAQVKVYNGEEFVNIQEIILHDAETGSDGQPSEDIGVINGDSILAVGEGYVDNVNAGEQNLKVRNVELIGDDAHNYNFVDNDYSEKLLVQRNQVKGAIAENTYKYTGKDITLTADDVYLIDQAGDELGGYDVIYYYHNGEGIEKVDALNRMGKYTVIARPEQDNYKGGAVQTIYVTSGDEVINAVDKSAASALIDIYDTATVYKADGKNEPAKADATKGTAKVEYYNGGAWTETVPANAGRYLIRATVTNGTVTDTAYGIYTIAKARPEIDLNLGKHEKVYDSALMDTNPTVTSSENGEVYYSYAGDVTGGVAYQAPQNVGTYSITAHVNETENYTAFEMSDWFAITPKELTIKADSYMRQRFGAFPKMTATYTGLATGGVAKDTSLRDVQIQPEFTFVDYTNIDNTTAGETYVYMDDVLATNYDVKLFDHGNDQEAGIFTSTDNEPYPTLVIKGYGVDGDGNALAYYGDHIQLYTYGSKTDMGKNTSSFITWTSSNENVAKFVDKADEDNASATSGWLKTVGVGTTTITVTRGIGVTAISTSFELTVAKQEVMVSVPESNVVYNDSTYNKTMTGITPRVLFTAANPVVNDSEIVKGNETRSEVGTQVTTGTVDAANPYYQSETYGGLFTVNDREVTVTPVEATTVYGTTVTGLTYTEGNTVAGEPALTADGLAVSNADVYNNLDVHNGYEILVAGREEKNYNVKYVTDQTAPDAEVTAKAITVTNGAYPGNKGMTDGAVIPQGDYDAKGFDFDTAKAFQQNSVRMYGEPNWVMGIDEAALTAALVEGDSLADLNALLAWLNECEIGDHHNIDEDANVKYDAQNVHITGRETDYKVNSTLSIKNYNVENKDGIQNIYQRPVDLVLRDGLTKLNIFRNDIYDGNGNIDNAKLLKIIEANLIATEHNGEGGLAKLLNHTIKDLNLQITVTDNGNGTLSVKVTVGNLNYWSEGADISVDVELTKVVAKYSALGKTTSYVYMYNIDEAGNETAITGPLTGTVTYKIYVRDEADDGTMGYADYVGKTPVREVEMEYVSGNTYKATYSSLPAGKYVMFAIANNYTIVD